jgi:hypothetical protein
MEWKSDIESGLPLTLYRIPYTELPLGRLHNLAGFETTGADSHPFCLTILDGPYFLKIGIPTFFGLIMGMAYITPDNRPFAANFTYF